MVDFVLQHEKDIRQAVYEKRNDWGDCQSIGNDIVKNPTANKAVKQASEIECVLVEYYTPSSCRPQMLKIIYPERWLHVIDCTRAAYAKHELGRDILQSYCNGEKWYDACDRLFISNASYYRVLGDIKLFAKGVARGMELIQGKAAKL